MKPNETNDNDTRIENVEPVEKASSEEKPKDLLAEFATKRALGKIQADASQTGAPLDEVKFSAKHTAMLVMDSINSVKKVVVPVAVCLILVVAAIRTLKYYSLDEGLYLPYFPYHDNSASLPPVVKFGQAIVNSLVLIAVILVSTLIVVLLYYYRCYRFLNGYMYFSIIITFAFLGGMCLAQIFDVVNYPFDMLTFAVINYNITVLALISIAYTSPLIMRQIYLVFMAVITSLMFVKFMPEWTVWVFLVAISIYDILAVLCPRGPLNLLVQLVHKRKVDFMPAAIYSTVAYTMMADTNEPAVSDQPTQVQSRNSQTQLVRDEDNDNNNNGNNNNDNNNDGEVKYSPDMDDDEFLRLFSNSLKLGMGDFIFYSVLIGKAAATSDFNVVYSCIVGLLFGLVTTLLILFTLQRALPALPFSILFGMIAYFSSYYSVTPMMTYYQKNMIFL